MKATKGSENSSKKNSNTSVVIVSFLLLISIAISFIGILKEESEDVSLSDDSKKDSVDFVEVNDDESLSDMFQKEFSKISKNGVYEADDPFKETCASVDGVKPATTSFTVCQPATDSKTEKFK